MLWTLIGLATLLALLSLRGEAARAKYYRDSLASADDRFTPPATVIVPVKGADDGLAENLASLAAMDYPDFELIVVARAESDLRRDAVPPRARVVFAGDGDPSSGEKINNLLAAVQSARPSSEVFAFADSDGRAGKGWLRALVRPLQDAQTGVAAGYRWHLPKRGGLWPLLRSVWNAVIAGGMGPGSNRFCWGGAMAVRRETFFALQIPAWWRGAVSDDYRMSEAVRAAGLGIAFAPGAMVAAVDQTTCREFLGWSRRQMMITRFYARPLWFMALFAHAVYCGSMVAAALLMAKGSRLAACALVFQLGIGWYKGARRIQLARRAMPDYRAWFARYGVAHVLLVPVGTWLWLWSAAAAAWGRNIKWRGYRLRLRALPRP